jgi:hypothetical protein
MSAVEQGVNPAPVAIRLTAGQMCMASHISCLRRVSNIYQQRPHRYGQTSHNWTGDVHGLCAEVATSSYLNLHWAGTLGDMKARDVGGLIEVRSCDPGRRLILHPEDADEAPFVLAWIDLPTIKLCGWLLGSEAKQQEFWDDPGTGRPAYFVPAGKLHSMTMLREWVDDNVRGLWEEI